MSHIEIPRAGYGRYKAKRGRLLFTDFQNTVHSLYLEHPLSRTSLYVELNYRSLCLGCNLFSYLSRTLRISNEFPGPLRVRDRGSQLFCIGCSDAWWRYMVVRLIADLCSFPKKMAHWAKNPLSHPIVYIITPCFDVVLFLTPFPFFTFLRRQKKNDTKSSLYLLLCIFFTSGYITKVN